MVDYDVLIVGAGISGIGAAVHLKTKAPGKRFAIVEGRERLGGTWDLFRYPGIRSDSDMYTLGFDFKPWTEAKAIADAPSILNYLRETVDEYQLEPLIRFQTRVVGMDWSTDDGYWTVTVETGPGKSRETITARFMYLGTGYYNYTDPYRPDFPEEASFKGPIIHPQLWPDNLDYQGKRVAVIGSGATAVTLIPAMADGGAAHMTMVQRSPSYILSRPAEDKLANTLRATLPGKLAYTISRWKNILMGWFLFSRSQAKPDVMKEHILKLAQEALGPDYPVNKHLSPSYGPWDQRMCLIPDNDMFRVMKEGKADIVTGHIERFTAEGIQMKTGEFVPADIIITATGLKMEIMSGVAMKIDGQATKVSEHLSYKGFMYSGIPNLASAFGYSNASWTLKADLIANYVCRLLNHMDAQGVDIALPDATGVAQSQVPYMGLSSGYVQRALEQQPRLGDREPWINHHNYFTDRKNLRNGRLDDDMRFLKSPAKSGEVRIPELAEAAE